jgi:hypothetical protein
MCGSAPTGRACKCFDDALGDYEETHTYMGGLIGTFILVALIVFVMRSA